MLQDSEATARFVDLLIDAKLKGAPIEPDVRATLHRNLVQRLETQITAAIAALLNDQEQIELEHLVDTNQISAIEPYLEKHHIDLNRVLAGVMTEFQASYVGV